MSNTNTFVDFIISKNNASLYLYRLDKLQPYIQGNKYFKLKYNIEEAVKKHLPVLTIGGAFSNHIHATAIACKQRGVPSYALVRGNNYKEKSPTLLFAEKLDMQLIFTDREDYKILRNIDSDSFICNELLQKYSQLPQKYFYVPEGGTNKLGIKGATEILEGINISDFDTIYCSVGSGGTLSGVINFTKGQKDIKGIACVKDKSLTETIASFTNGYKNWELNFNYTFKGFGKWNNELVQFINNFYNEYKIPLDPIYTSKMMYAIFDLIEQNYFKKPTNILAIHTGGLQGIAGFNLMNNNVLKLPTLL